MALKLIIDTDAVIARMSLQDIAEVRAAIDSTLNAAHVVLQGMLHTTFEPNTRTDTFFLHPELYPTPVDGLLCCKLSQGFVQADTPLVINFNAESRKALVTAPEAMPAEDYILDAMRGYVMVDVAYTGYWVNIAYKAGFDSTHKAPIWLQEAVLAYLPHLLSHPEGSLDTAAMTAATEAQKMAWNITGKIVEPYVRNRAFQFNAYGT
jgi:hypothetical protein